MNDKLQEWIEQQFQPWQKAVRQAQEQRAAGEDQFRRNTRELQKIIGMLLDGKVSTAVDLWNRIGLSPQLRDVRVDTDTDVITLIPAEGEELKLSIDQMLEELQAMVSGQELKEGATLPAQEDGF
jgi:hypothetical protein